MKSYTFWDTNCEVRWMSADISEWSTASIFWVEAYAQHETGSKQNSWLLHASYWFPAAVHTQQKVKVCETEVLRFAAKL
jgi:hypothetical protein